MVDAVRIQIPSVASSPCTLPGLEHQPLASVHERNASNERLNNPEPCAVTMIAQTAAAMATNMSLRVRVGHVSAHQHDAAIWSTC